MYFIRTIGRLVYETSGRTVGNNNIIFDGLSGHNKASPLFEIVLKNEKKKHFRFFVFTFF